MKSYGKLIFKKKYMRTEFKNAKDMFLHFGGSKYFMARQEQLEKYEKYNISEETEKEWIKEHVEDLYSQLDIKKNQTILTLFNFIKRHNYIICIDKIILFMKSQIDEVPNQYYMSLYARYIFNLVERLSIRNNKKQNKFALDTRINCIHTAILFNNKAKKMRLDENFQIPNFSQIGEGLTQQQYVLRKITSLNREIILARILEV